MCAPSAPNPQATIQQQTASNKETAIAQAGLNYVDQIGPNGNLTYQQMGTWSDGTPRYQQTTTLSPSGQALQKTNETTQQNLASLAQEQSGRLSGLLSQPLDWSAQQTYLNDLTAGALDKSWDRQSEQNEQSLINRGIRPGSTAYQQQIGDFRTDRSNAYNAANASNFTTALQSQLAVRQQPINEILALSGQSQLQAPQFGQVNSPGIAGTDTAGITNNAYQQQMQGYNAGQSTLGGLFSAGASLIPLLSDRRTKTDIRAVGKLDNGLTVYSYRYVDGGGYQIGLMADEVKAMRPSAVVTGNDGFDRVRYLEAVA